MLRHAIARTMNMPSQDNFWEVVSASCQPLATPGRPAFVGMGWGGVGCGGKCDLEHTGAQQQNSDVGTPRIPPPVGMGAKREAMGGGYDTSTRAFVCVCVDGGGGLV